MILHKHIGGFVETGIPGGDVLDKDISDAASLISILLVFVFAYFAAVTPQIGVLLAEERPGVGADRERLGHRLKGVRWQITAIAVLVIAVFALLIPLSWRVISAWSWHGKFHTLRVGLLGAEVLLLATFIVLARIWLKLSNRIKEMR
jgi:hypothetical protein